MMFWVLGPSARAAYLRVARSWGLPLAHMRALRHTEMPHNDRSHAHICSGAREAQHARLAGPAQPAKPPESARGPPELPKDSFRAAALPKPPKSPS